MRIRGSCPYVVLAGLITCGLANCQSPAPTPSPTFRTDVLARKSKAGNHDATVALARQMFLNAGIPTDLADSLGFTDRVVASESAYRKGEHAGASEQAVVRAINNMVIAIGAPAWSKTDLIEVRKFRMLMLSNNPELVGDRSAPDSHGRYKALADNMSPVELGFVTIGLIYQKRYNPEFQASDAERTADESLAVSRLPALCKQRTAELHNLLEGRTRSLSIRDLLSVSDHLFSDLGMEPTAQTGAVAQLLDYQSGIGGVR